MPGSPALRSDDRPRPQRWRPWGWLLPSPCGVAFGLLAAGALPPLGLALLPAGREILGAPRTGIVLAATLIFAPAIAGSAAALQGFDTVLARLRQGAGSAFTQAIGRVLLDALALIYVLGLLAVSPADPAVTRCLLAASLQLGAAWVLLLYLMFDPARTAQLRHLALGSDLVLLSLLLAAGGGRTAALAPIYLYLAVGYTDGQGTRARAAGIAFTALAFVVVVAVTPFWRGELGLAAGMWAAMILLPAYVGARLGELGVSAARETAENAGKDRFLLDLGEDLRGPLRAIARAGAEIDLDALGPSQRDAIALTRLNARTMLLQLDDVLGYVKLDTGGAAPETRSFDLYRLANGAVAALRAAAAECGALLDLRIDPQLPHQLYGWPHQLRQVLIGLVANGLRHSGKAKLRIDLGAAELAGSTVVLRVAVSTGPPEATGAVSGIAETGRHLGLAVIERLVERMGGHLAVDARSGHGLSLAAELPFAIDQAFLARPLDLAGLPVLIASDDAELAETLLEPLEAWRAAPRWVGAGAAALDELDGIEQGSRRGLLIVDGCGDVLRALSWTHRAAALLMPEPPHILFVADESRIDSIIGLADGELDIILPAPLTAIVLRSALHSLMIEPVDDLAAGLPPALPRPARRLSVGETPVEPLDYAPARIASPPSEPRTNRPWQVVIATENASNRRIMGSLLSRAGHAVHLVATADEARKRLETHDVDVLLLDLAGTNGTDYEAARLCRRTRPGVTIIALTTDGAADAERRAREIGLDLVLRKPVGAGRLMAVIETTMEGRSAETMAGPVVAALASHPRFTADPNPPSAERLAGVRPLRQSDAFFGGAVETFRVDYRRIVGKLSQSAGAGDAEAFEAGLEELHASTANFGAARLRALLHSMRGQSAAALRQQGAEFVQRLDAELRRLDAALAERLRAAN